MRVLVVEDEVPLAETIRHGLTEDGFVVEVVHNGEDGVWAATEHPYDVIVLDIMLPKLNGYKVLEQIRERGVWAPVLMLTAKDGDYDQTDAFDLGADDYLTKPFSFIVLIARLRALIRRASGNSSSELTAGPVRLDTRSGRVTLDGEPVKLTAQEYKLLSYLLHHKGKVVSRTELIEHIYDQDFDRDSNTIEVFVTRIRKKLGADVITTIRGLGYSLDDPAAPRG